MKDIVFNDIDFSITDNTVLNIRYKALEQSQSSTENKDAGIKKERSIFPAEIVVEKSDKNIKNFSKFTKRKS